MASSTLTGLNRNKLRLWLGLFFLALAIPTTLLVQQAYQQLKWEALHQQQTLAEELTDRIGNRYGELIQNEEKRSFADYAFLNLAGNPQANFLQRSPLSSFPIELNTPGLIGYFQVDADGIFSTPLLPPIETSLNSYGIGKEEQQERLALQQHIGQILKENRLTKGSASPPRELVKSDKKNQRQFRDAPAALAPPSEDEDMTEADMMEAEEGFVVEEKIISPEMALAVGQAAFDQLKDGDDMAPGRGMEQRAPQKQASDSSFSIQQNKSRATLGQVEDLRLDYSYQQEANKKKEAEQRAKADQKIEATKRKQEERKRKEKVTANYALKREHQARKEQISLPEPMAPAGADIAAAPAPPQIRISTFESEIDPFEFSLLDSGHFVLYRKVWRNGNRYIQGMLLDQQPFIRGIIEQHFRGTALSQISNLVVAYEGDVISAFQAASSRSYLPSSKDLSGTLLHRSRLASPVDPLELIFTITRLPPAPGSTLINWIAITLAIVLCGGLYLMYRLGLRQIELARQQQDFVSAVSHELKTPLTSIRMYSEMLREGWASDEKKRGYYGYIHDESERLSRLISNVLQLARMTRNDLKVDLKSLTVSELMDGIRSKVSSQAERAGFELNLKCDHEMDKIMLKVDADFFSQIFINLVDNAIKFSAKAEHKLIEIDCQRLQDGGIEFSVRDYGPGIAKDQIKKIFRLFYRSENELTRETVGTGIGLALVKQLAASMNARIDVLNKEPGAEFRVRFPALKQ